MSTRAFFALVAVLSLAAGGLLWWSNRPAPAPAIVAMPASISPAALFAASFTDPSGERVPIGRFEGKVLLINFWATWCAPCLEEMPAFARLQDRWRDRGVQFLGLSSEDPALAARFGAKLGVNYPLWTGGEEVAELSRRLGNAAGVLPHSALVGPDGRVVASKVGPYSEEELEALLGKIAQKSF
jgi:thiol-disulfide isomerase/thioredoxin